MIWFAEWDDTIRLLAEYLNALGSSCDGQFTGRR